MTKKAYIVSTDNGRILAAHLDRAECAGCRAACDKKPAPFEVANPKGMAVTRGSLVLICASRLVQALQGGISLLFPFVCAVLGYMLAPAIMALFRKSISNDAKALFVLLFLFVSSLIVFILTRVFPIPGKPQIVEVL